jgi:hypothetical protein
MGETKIDHATSSDNTIQCCGQRLEGPSIDEVLKREHERSETANRYNVQTARHNSPTTIKSTQMWKDSTPKEKQDIVIDSKGKKNLVNASKAKRTSGKLLRCFYESISTCSNNSL